MSLPVAAGFPGCLTCLVADLAVAADSEVDSPEGASGSVAAVTAVVASRLDRL